jgi:uncharacterized RDD family membrane protein YckC
LIDGVPAFVLYLIGLVSGKLAILALFYLLALAWTLYNRAYLAGTTGQSWGKKIIGIRLVKEETGEPMGAVLAFVRDIAHTVDAVICFVGYLFPLWDAKGQTLADKIMTTVVVPA